MSGGFSFGVGMAPAAVAPAGGVSAVDAAQTVSRGLVYLGLVLAVGGGFFLLVLWPAGRTRRGCRRLLWAGRRRAGGRHGRRVPARRDGVGRRRPRPGAVPRAGGRHVRHAAGSSARHPRGRGGAGRRHRPRAAAGQGSAAAGGGVAGPGADRHGGVGGPRAHHGPGVGEPGELVGAPGGDDRVAGRAGGAGGGSRARPPGRPGPGGAGPGPAPLVADRPGGRGRPRGHRGLPDVAAGRDAAGADRDRLRPGPAGQADAGGRHSGCRAGELPARARPARAGPPAGRGPGGTRPGPPRARTWPWSAPACHCPHRPPPGLAGGRPPHQRPGRRRRWRGWCRRCAARWRSRPGSASRCSPSPASWSRNVPPARFTRRRSTTASRSTRTPRTSPWIRPCTAGRPSRLRFLDPDRKPVDVAEAQARLNLPPRGLGPLTCTLRPAGEHVYSCPVVVPEPGEWELRLTVRVSDFDSYFTSSTFTVR